MTALLTGSAQASKAAADNMVLVPGGDVWIGSNDGSDAEKPQHAVNVPAFFIDPVPVTNAMFREFVTDTHFVTEAERIGAAWGYANGDYRQVAALSWRSYATTDRDDHPVVLVSWHDAVTYAAWAKKRLPTEIEWEKAARGGLHQKLYPWGDDAPEGRCNWRRAAADIPPTSDVRAFEANSYGLYDVVGNVWQWCSDAFVASYSPSSEAAPGLRSRRGGAWNVIQPFRLRCANRGAMQPTMAAPNVGFRCALSI
ncbi:MAG: formylglycine-generating enzyme family protein [Acidobacteriota bacterium]|nr:formylglycine-generating enzyme family protein [Acidobacteriota bacterium]